MAFMIPLHCLAQGYFSTLLILTGKDGLLPHLHRPAFFALASGTSLQFLFVCEQYLGALFCWFGHLLCSISSDM